MTPPNAPTAAERAGDINFLERLAAEIDAGELTLHWRRDRDWLREIATALLAARRERETAYETTAQVRDALSEEILKLRDHLAAARRENEASTALRERVRLEAASLDDYANELAEGTLTGRVLVGASRRLMDAYTAALAATETR